MKKKAVVIGGGFGGLSSAALLARDGWDVVLLEQLETLGGRARFWESEGFTFDLGPSWYLMPEVFERYFSLFGKERSSYYDLTPLEPYYKVYFNEQEQIQISSNMENNYALFERFEKGGGDALKRYMEQSTYKYNIAMKDFLYRDYHRLSDFFSKRLMTEGVKLGIFKKLDSFVGSFVNDRRARQILEYAMVFLGTNPIDAPAIYSIMSHVDMELGVYFPTKGMAHVAQSIATLCKELGVSLHTGQEVVHIEVKNGKAVSVKTTKDTFEADVVVSSADYQHVESSLLSSESVSYNSSYWNKRIVAPSMFISYLGVGRKLSQLSHHNLYFSKDWQQHFHTIFTTKAWPKDPCFYMSCISKTDPSSAPEDSENVFLLVPVAPALDDNEEQRESYFTHLIEHVYAITKEDLSQDLRVKRIYSHQDFSQDYHSFKGTALGLSHTLFQTAVFRPSRRSKKVENLFFTGQYTHPGVGVPMVLIASELVAKEIQSVYGT